MSASTSSLAAELAPGVVERLVRCSVREWASVPEMAAAAAVVVHLAAVWVQRAGG